jgi:hypothetical protein
MLALVFLNAFTFALPDRLPCTLLKWGSTAIGRYREVLTAR